MKTVGNFIWYIFPGYIMALFNLIMGLAFCLTIVLIPVGRQLFKLANCYVLPMKAEFLTNFEQYPMGNFFFNFFLVGFLNAIIMILVATFYCVTIVGIPLGKKAYQLAKLSICPVGLIVM